MKVEQIYGRESLQAIYRTERFLSMFNEVIGNCRFFKISFNFILSKCAYTLNTIQNEINNSPEGEDTTERKKMHEDVDNMVKFLTVLTLDGSIDSVLKHLLP